MMTIQKMYNHLIRNIIFLFGAPIQITNQLLLDMSVCTHKTYVYIGIYMDNKQQTHNGKSEMQNNLIIQINRHRICTTVNAAHSIHTSQIASYIHTRIRH